MHGSSASFVPVLGPVLMQCTCMHSTSAYLHALDTYTPQDILDPMQQMTSSVLCKCVQRLKQQKRRRHRGQTSTDADEQLLAAIMAELQRRFDQVPVEPMPLPTYCRRTADVLL